MATNFPTGLDALVNPIPTQTLDSPSHSTQHGTLNDAVEALEAKVGVDGSAVATSHDKILTLKANILSPTFTGTPTLPTGTIATTQTAGNSTTAVATTAFVTTADALKADVAGPTFTSTVAVTGGALGTTAGNELIVSTITATNTNQDIVSTKYRRVSTGTDWQTAQAKIQRTIDVTDMGYVAFGGTSAQDVRIGSGTTDIATFVNNGRVGIGTTTPATTLDVNGTVTATLFSGPLTGNVNGTASNAADVDNGVITTAKLDTGAVTAAKIASGAVTSSELASLAVTNAKIASGAVDTTQLAAGAVTNSKIVDDAVQTSKIKDGVVTGPKIYKKIQNFTGPTYTVTTTDWILSHTTASDVVVTLPDAATYEGRSLQIRNTVSNVISSAANNIVALTSAGTPRQVLGINLILSGTDGAWCELVSNGTNWLIVNASELT